MKGIKQKTDAFSDSQTCICQHFSLPSNDRVGTDSTKKFVRQSTGVISPVQKLFLARRLSVVWKRNNWNRRAFQLQVANQIAQQTQSFAGRGGRKFPIFSGVILGGAFYRSEANLFLKLPVGCLI